VHITPQTSRDEAFDCNLLLDFLETCERLKSLDALKNDFPPAILFYQPFSERKKTQLMIFVDRNKI